MRYPRLVAGLLSLLCVCTRDGVVVDVIHRLSVELLQYFLYDVGCVRCIMVYAGCVEGSGFFIVGLGGG